MGITLAEVRRTVMGIKDRRLKWLLALSGLALLPIGMTAAVMRGLAQVRAEGEQRPRVVAAWASGPMEARIAFDRAADPGVVAPLVGQSISFADPNDPPAEPGRPPTGGRPGGNGGSIRIAAARLDDSGRTLVLVTDPHPTEATYRLTLPDLKGAGTTGPGRAEAVTYTLGGVEVTWTPDGAERPEWSGWWPEVDPTRARAALTGSVEHDRLWPLLGRPGKLVLQSFVRLPSGPTASTITSEASGEATLGQESAKLAPNQPATLKAEAQEGPVELTITLATRVGGKEVPSIHWRVAPASTPPDHAPALSRWAFSLAWAPILPTPMVPDLPAGAQGIHFSERTPTLRDPLTASFPKALATGGDPERGAAVFAGETARCATCHQFRGVGGKVGPDLSNLDRSSRAWVYNNIVEPSAEIHPDYVTYTVALKDGRVAMGTVRAEGADAIRVGDNDAKFTTFPRAEVEELRPSTSSIMPVGLLQALGDERTRDLLAYLTTPPPITPGPRKPATEAARPGSTDPGH